MPAPTGAETVRESLPDGGRPGTPVPEPVAALAVAVPVGREQSGDTDPAARPSTQSAEVRPAPGLEGPVAEQSPGAPVGGPGNGAPAGAPSGGMNGGMAGDPLRPTCTTAQLRRFIKSRPWIPMHELRRRFGVMGGDDDVTPIRVGEHTLFIGLPPAEGRLMGELLASGDIGYELSLDPVTPIVVGVYPMRPVPRG